MYICSKGIVQIDQSFETQKYHSKPKFKQLSYNSFGQIFRITTHGESHGPGIGVIIDGCPAGIEFDYDLLKYDLQRRRPGQSKYTTPRNEKEAFEINSGIFEGRTTGTPIHIFIPNKNQKPKDYSQLKDVYRPSHADFTYQNKYGIRDHRGGGRSSARETAARVAAGAIAKQICAYFGIKIRAYTDQIGAIRCPELQGFPRTETIEASLVRCPEESTSKEMILFLEELLIDGDTAGGCVRCICEGMPIGLGEPIYKKLNAQLASAMLSINAAKGIEFGLGFESAVKLGSEQNDEFYQDHTGNIKTRTNFSGGIQGGISNGMPLDFRVAFKAVSSIKKPQETVDKQGNQAKLAIDGRHDPCVIPRAVPIVEAMCAIVLADALLQSRSNKIT